MTPSSPVHDHVYLGKDHGRNETRTRLVIALTLTMMVAEIVAGTVYGSMALLADGWHMATHAAALGISALAYAFARRHARNPRYTFGTGKVGDLAAFSSAVLLALVALLIGWESLLRLADPIQIRFAEALTVAVIGLAVNVASAVLLMSGGRGHHDHDHPAHAHQDHNLRAAYLHVLADALTSVLAIAALLLGRLFDVVWLDPVIGLLGAVLILNWSRGLIRQTAAILLDHRPAECPVESAIRSALDRPGDRIADLHVWQLGPGHFGAIVSVVAAGPLSVADCRARLAHVPGLSHLTVEVTPA